MTGTASVTVPAAAGLVGVHLLHEGEIVQLLLKPSRWFIPLQSLRFTAVTTILVIAATLLDRHVPGDKITFVQTGLFLVAGRLMFCVLQWMGRLYVLTNLRVVRIGGVWSPEMSECPLRRIGLVQVQQTTGDRLFRVGTVQINCMEPARTCAWQSVSNPVRIREIIAEAARRAQSGN